MQAAEVGHVALDLPTCSRNAEAAAGGVGKQRAAVGRFVARVLLWERGLTWAVSREHHANLQASWGLQLAGDVADAGRAAELQVIVVERPQLPHGLLARHDSDVIAVVVKLRETVAFVLGVFELQKVVALAVFVVVPRAGPLGKAAALA